MWKLKRMKFFMKRLADLERVLQQEERLEEVNITRVDMCENLMQKMAVEEQEAMEECKMAAKQRVRWADVEEGQKGEKEEKLERRRKKEDRWKKRVWREINQCFMERDRDCMEKAEDGQFRWEEWEWESLCAVPCPRRSLVKRN